MEAIKANGGGGRVGIGGKENMADGMQCSFHLFRNNPGEICAFCLQEKLRKLVSSSFLLLIHPSSTSSSSSPSFKSNLLPSSASLTTIIVSSLVAATSSSSFFNKGIFGIFWSKKAIEFLTKRCCVPLIKKGYMCSNFLILREGNVRFETRREVRIIKEN